MGTNTNNSKKLSQTALILMIFTSVFGFANMPRSFYLTGYAAIPWYVISGLTFFIPYAFMMSEYGAAFKEEKGGIYSWMTNSVGPRYAFIGTFMWYASYIIWMVNVGSAIMIPLSNAVYGTDTTATWSLFGLSSTQTLGLIGVLWITLVTFTATKGLEQISKITSVGGTAVAALNILLLLGGLIVLVANGGELAQPIASAQAFTQAPNPSYQSPLAMLSFLVFAIFAYGGIEVAGGLVDQTENPEQTFPKGVTIAAIVITVGYAIGIFMVGTFLNWDNVLSSDKVHMGNAAYVVLGHLGYALGQGFGMTEAASLTLGAWIARFVGFSMFLTLTGAFFTLTYAPLKQLIQGTPKELWPGKLGEIQDGMPKNAMWIQCIFVIVMMLLVSFGGDAAAAFFTKLVLMTNVAMTLPYMFLSGAFAKFKKNADIKKPFEVYKSYTSALIASIVVTFTVGFANFFTIIEPATRGDMSSTLWMIAGPLFFTIVAWLMYSRYESRTKA